jgi:hypothetical protein
LNISWLRRNPQISEALAQPFATHDLPLKLDSRPEGGDADGMSPDRFNECLRYIRWTPINLASALQCDLSWIEALETGNEDVPTGPAWLETLAQAHEAFPPPTTYRRGWARL